MSRSAQFGRNLLLALILSVFVLPVANAGLVEIYINNSEENRLPAFLEAEEALFGSVLVNNDLIDEISSIVNSHKFFDPGHRKIYEVIENLNNKGMIANPITLKNYFETNDSLSEVGGVDYLVKLTRFSSSIKQAIDYSKIIHEMYVRRAVSYTHLTLPTKA